MLLLSTISGRRASCSDSLTLIHAACRRELALIRKEVAASGTHCARLRVNCLTVCHGLHYHHTEHERIAVLLEELEQLIATPAPDLLPKVDELIGQLTAHLDRDEAELLLYL